jgi:dienelactone hydrolase
MSPAPPWLRAAERRAAKTVRRLRAARGGQVRTEPLQLQSTAGYQLAAMIHRPAGAARLPAVVLCPGIDHGGAIFDTDQVPIRAAEVAQLGCVVATFDPAGRGESWGSEDFGGPEHQDNVCTVVQALADRPDVDRSQVGIVAISLGVSMAIGAAAGAHNPPAPVAWVIDWEGPCDREIITAGGTKMAPAMGHSLDDEDYWQPREAVCHVGALRCGYLRLQSRIDHAQPGELRHAQRMMAAAAAGSAPWVQLNRHPRGARPDREDWLPPGQLAANRALLAAIDGLLRP